VAAVADSRILTDRADSDNLIHSGLSTVQALCALRVGVSPILLVGDCRGPYWFNRAVRLRRL